MAPECESRDAGLSGVPERSREALLRSEKASRVQDAVRERDHVHLTFVTVWCHKFYLLVILVNLLLCLIYKLKLYHRRVCIGKNIIWTVPD